MNYKKVFKIFVHSVYISLALMFFSSCASTEKKVFDDMYKYNITVNKDKKQLIKNEELNLQNDEIIIDKQKIKKSKPPFVFIKNLNYNKNKDKTLSEKNEKKVLVNVNNIPINKFIKLIFGQILKFNYTVSSAVEKDTSKITLDMSKGMSKNSLLNISTRILKTHNIMINKDNNNNYFIEEGRQDSVEKLGSNFYFGLNLPKNIGNDEKVVLFVPYYYINIGILSSMIKTYYLSKDAIMKAIPTKQIFMFKDKVSNLRNMLYFLKTVDKPVMKNKITALIKFEHINVETFIQRIRKILPKSGIKIAFALNSLGIMFEPISEINSLFIVSDKKEWIDTIRYWKNKIDIINIDKEEERIFVYKPNNRKASELKELIEKLFSTTSVDNNLSTKSNNTTKQKSVLKKLSVIDDKNRNTLIIKTTTARYKEILQMLRKLDVLPKQVLIEVTIAELTLKDSLKHGFEWFIKNESKYNSNFSTLKKLGIGGTGLIGNISKIGGDFSVILNLFAQKNLINILSSPKIVVLDNQEANITIGNEIPILSSSTTTSSADTTDSKSTQNIEYRNTGIILSVKPIINSNGILTLDISQTVSEAQENDKSSISSPIILNRNIKTSVLLKSNQSLLLGGLIKENKSKTVSKVPFFGDLPFIGYLFRSESFSKNKTELMVIVKPIIIDNTDKSHQITEKFRILLNKD